MARLPCMCRSCRAFGTYTHMLHMCLNTQLFHDALCVLQAASMAKAQAFMGRGQGYRGRAWACMALRALGPIMGEWQHPTSVTPPSRGCCPQGLALHLHQTPGWVTPLGLNQERDPGAAQDPCEPPRPGLLSTGCWVTSTCWQLLHALPHWTALCSMLSSLCMLC